ncbi:MAG: hypothetical protein ACLGHQ_04540, partial [Acidimicrobiia bacterium]
MESNALASTEPAASPAVRELLERAARAQDTDTSAARQYALQARVQARADGDRVGEAESLYRLASLAHFEGDPEDAFGLAMEASEVAARAGAKLV